VRSRQWFCAVRSRQWFQGLGVSSRVAKCKGGHPKPTVFPFVVGMNHEVRTRRQLCWLLPIKAMWEREATCWRGPGRRRTTIRNMAKTGLRWNGGQGLHVRLAVMLVTNCLFQKSHYFFRVYSYCYCRVKRLKFLFALEACSFSSSELYEDEKAIWWINMYKFWIRNEIPGSSRLAAGMLCIPATCASSESFFNWVEGFVNNGELDFVQKAWNMF